MYRHLVALILVMTCLASHTAWGQFGSLELGAMAGNMLDIYPGMPTHNMQKGMFATIRKQDFNAYSSHYGNPYSGVMLSFHDLGNKQVLGHAVGLQYQFSMEQSLGQHWRSFERINIGGIWVSKPYHFIHNPGNIVFGSSLSALITASAGLSFIANPFAFSTHISYWHSSNGHTVLPNVGMNTPMLMASVEYRLSDRYRKEIPTLELPTQFAWIIYGALGFNEAGGTVRPTNGSTYKKQLFATGATWRLRTIHRLSLTAEMYHDETYRLWNTTMQWNTTSPRLASSAVMLMAGHEFIYGRFSLLIQAGLNIYNPTLHRLIGEVEQETVSNRLKSHIPGRFALRYYINKPEYNAGSAFVQAAVKSNMGQADFFELGIGLLISKSPDPQ